LPKQSYSIYVENLTFFCIVGILDFERRERQKVVANVKIDYVNDGENFINYAEVATLIEETMQVEKYLLLEEALSALVRKLKSQYSEISSINLKLSKPDILENCDVGVEIFKKY